MPNAIFTTKKYVDDKINAIENIDIIDLGEVRQGSTITIEAQKLQEIKTHLTNNEPFVVFALISSIRHITTDVAYSIASNVISINFDGGDGFSAVLIRCDASSGDGTISDILTQELLDDGQLDAVNSGITSSKVSTYDGYASQIANKQNKAQTVVEVEFSITDLSTLLGTSELNKTLTTEQQSQITNSTLPIALLCKDNTETNIFNTYVNIGKNQSEYLGVIPYRYNSSEKLLVKWISFEYKPSTNTLKIIVINQNTPKPSIDITSLVGGQPLTTEQLEIIKNNNIVRFYSDSLGYDFTASKVITPVMNAINPNNVSFSFINDTLEAELDTFTIDISTGTFSGKAKIIAQDLNLESDKLQLYSGDSQIGNGLSKSQMQSWLNSQEKLISGTNIKTINNQSLLGSGNINIESGSTNINIVELGRLENGGGTLTMELTNKIFALAGTPVMFVGAFEGMRFTTSNVVLNSSTTLNILLFAYGSRFIAMALTRSSGAYTITQTNA